MQTFANLPSHIAAVTDEIISRSDIKAIQANAEKLHNRYMSTSEDQHGPRITKPADTLAYLSLRFPATYAQLFAAFTQIQERVPSWQPKTVLDIGCGPGTGIWAAKEVWPDIQSAVGIDRDTNFLSLAEEIHYEAKVDLAVKWVHQTIDNWTRMPEPTRYDLIIVGSVVNELTKNAKEDFLDALTKQCSGIVVVLEPGTPRGFGIIQSVAAYVSAKSKLIAPYVGGAFIPSEDFWIHFPQRFLRPDFQRRVRQHMRNSPMMASDWEEAKFSYVAWGDVAVEKQFWGQTVGDVQKYHGYLIIPVLTEKGIVKARIMKRQKALYASAKHMRWGESIENPIESTK